MTISHHFSAGFVVITQHEKLKMSWDFIYYMDMLFNKGYEETTSSGRVSLKARRLCRIFDNALLAVIGRLAAEAVGKTWLSTRQRMSLDVEHDKE